MSNPCILLKVLPCNQVVEVSQEQTLLAACLEARIEISHSCGGFGTCGTCRVKVLVGLENLPPRNEVESEMAQDRGFAVDERLACQNHPTGPLVVEIPEEKVE